MRGLKLKTFSTGLRRYLVASFTDAWIETDNAIKLSGLEVVASFTDAWIETDTPISPYYGALSHLLQMRGLKHDGEPA